MNGARLELYWIIQDEKALKLVQNACAAEFDRLWREHKDEIDEMLPLLQEKFKELRRRGGDVTSESMTIEDNIEIRKRPPPGTIICMWMTRASSAGMPVPG